MIDRSEIRRIVGLPVVDERGRAIGSVEYVFNDYESGRPEWIGVVSGAIRRQRVLVPVAGAERRGSSLLVPWPRERVKQAPAYGERDRDGILGFGQYTLGISKEKERDAWTYYGLGERAPA